MKVFIFVVGCGECMCLLIDYMFKLLLMVGGKLFIVWYLECLVVVGFWEIVINYVYFGEQIKLVLGDGRQWGLNIQYLLELLGVLEIVGGIVIVLLLFGDEVFLVVNGDIYCDWDFNKVS